MTELDTLEKTIGKEATELSYRLFKYYVYGIDVIDKYLYRVKNIPGLFKNSNVTKYAFQSTDMCHDKEINEEEEINQILGMIDPLINFDNGLFTLHVYNKLGGDAGVGVAQLKTLNKLQFAYASSDLIGYVNWYKNQLKDYRGKLEKIPVTQPKKEEDKNQIAIKPETQIMPKLEEVKVKPEPDNSVSELEKTVEELEESVDDRDSAFETALYTHTLFKEGYFSYIEIENEKGETERFKVPGKDLPHPNSSEWKTLGEKVDIYRDEFKKEYYKE